MKPFVEESDDDDEEDVSSLSDKFNMIKLLHD